MRSEYWILVHGEGGVYLGAGHSDPGWLREWVDAGNLLEPGVERVELIQVLDARARPEPEERNFAPWSG